jgi:hypothetical protein
LKAEAHESGREGEVHWRLPTDIDFHEVAGNGGHTRYRGNAKKKTLIILEMQPRLCYILYVLFSFHQHL